MEAHLLYFLAGIAFTWLVDLVVLILIEISEDNDL